MSQIRSILIANRGEIASRIIRTCRKMGIKSIAVFSDADRQAPYVAEADLAVQIGENNPAASYLNQDRLIAAAKSSQADAIHPGYGFLSENAAFAQSCAAEGLIFIGPHPGAIEAMGSKSRAKTLMASHQVPVIPGYQGEDQGVERLQKEAKSIGFPVLLKAAAGGGGKGMRIVHKEAEMASAIDAAKRESLRSFGDEELIVEKYIPSGRHIEFQIFGDQHGHAIHLLERECTIQRRYQKVMEESPSPIMDEALRARMGEAAVRAAKALSYDNAGTVEFIYDEQSGEFYFLEVNTRLQVEHPVTEEITGLDLVQMQIESAQGLPLAMKQEEVTSRGYAIEVRLYAEDASNDFLPVTGKILRFDAPKVEGLRVETAVQSGSEISIFYDPMIAKLIVWDQSRTAALRKMDYVLRHLICQGITTNQAFLQLLLAHLDFQAGQYDTHFIQEKIDLDSLSVASDQALAYSGIAATLYGWFQREASRSLLRSMPSGWRNSFYAPQKERYLHGDHAFEVSYRYQKGSFEMTVGEQTYKAQLIKRHDQDLRIEIDGVQYPFHIAQQEQRYLVQHEGLGQLQLIHQDRFPLKEAEQIAGGYIAPMPSQIIKVLAEVGQFVSVGDPLLVLSSMKMENTLYAKENGQVEEVYATEGSSVEAGFLLLKLAAGSA